MNSRAKIVIDTEPMIAQPIWLGVSASSSRTTDISGAMPNHAKKHEKNANHVMWKVLICTIFTFKKLPQRLVALFCSSIEFPPILGRCKPDCLA